MACYIAWWRHQMETFSALLALCAGNAPVSGEFPTQRPVTRSFDVFFDLRLNKRLNKQSWGWWFETLSRPFWRHRNGPVFSRAVLMTAVSFVTKIRISRQLLQCIWHLYYEYFLYMLCAILSNKQFSSSSSRHSISNAVYWGCVHIKHNTMILSLNSCFQINFMDVFYNRYRVR